jgi:hypothetical protein
MNQSSFIFTENAQIIANAVTRSIRDTVPPLFTFLLVIFVSTMCVACTMLFLIKCAQFTSRNARLCAFLYIALTFIPTVSALSPFNVQNCVRLLGICVQCLLMFAQVLCSFTNYFFVWFHIMYNIWCFKAVALTILVFFVWFYLWLLTY